MCVPPFCVHPEHAIKPTKCVSGSLPLRAAVFCSPISYSDIAIKDAKRISHFMPRPAFLKLLLEKGLQQVRWKSWVAEEMFLVCSACAAALCVCDEQLAACHSGVCLLLCIKTIAFEQDPDASLA